MNVIRFIHLLTVINPGVPRLNTVLTLHRSTCEKLMLIKQHDRTFKPLVTAGAGALLAAVLSACGGGPIDNSGIPAAPAGNGGASNAANNNLALNGGSNANRRMTYEEWKAEEARSEEALKRAEAEAQKLSEAQRKKEEEEQQRIVTQAALELAKDYEDEKFDAQDPNAKDPVFVIVGLDKDSRLASDLMDRTGRRSKFVSLQGDAVGEYFKANCPVTEGMDYSRQQEGASEHRRTYECMAGIYVGRNDKGKMCYTFFDPKGQVTLINDNTAVPSFSPGNTVHPYPGYDAGVALQVSHDGVIDVPKRTINDTEVPGFKLLATTPFFTRLDVGGAMFMMLNTSRRYANPQGVEQKADADEPYRTQQAVFKFNSLAQTIDIYQKNNDKGLGTGTLDDNCIISFRTGIAGDDAADTSTAPGGSGSAAGNP